MTPLLEWIQKRLNLSTTQLEAYLWNEKESLEKLLTGLPIYSGHADRKDPIQFDTLSLRPTSEIQVNNGVVASSLSQYLYSRFGLILKHPRYPSLVQRASVLGTDAYYPLELAYVDKK
jgi:hypothetical protein